MNENIVEQTLHQKIDDLEYEVARLKEQDELHWKTRRTLLADRDRLKEELKNLSCPHCGNDVNGTNWKMLAGKMAEDLHILFDHECEILGGQKLDGTYPCANFTWSDGSCPITREAKKRLKEVLALYSSGGRK